MTNRMHLDTKKLFLHKKVAGQGVEMNLAK